MKPIKKNAGLLRSVRSWGVLGLILALCVTVGYGQLQVGPPQVVGSMTYQIFVESLSVERNQRTGVSANFEGQLEMRGEFSANNVATPIWPSQTSIVSAAQNQVVTINQLITTVTCTSPCNVPIVAKLWEIEYCCLGNMDYGQNSSSILLNGGPLIYQDVKVTTSSDNWRERSAILVIRFRAVKQ